MRKHLIGLGVVFQVALFFFSLLFAAASMWIVERFGDTALDVIVAVLAIPWVGVDVRYLTSAVLYFIFVVATTVVYGCGLAKCIKPASAAFWNRTWLKASMLALPVVFFLAVSFEMERRYSFYEFFFPDLEPTGFFAEQYRMLEPGMVGFPFGKKNLIVLILESVEDTYNDESVFGGGLMPNLARLEAGNAHFTGYVDSAGTRYSLAGLGSFFLGIPLLLPPDFVSRGWPKRYYPNAASLMKILEAHGYRWVVAMGVNAGFGDTGRVFEEHCAKVEILDQEAFKESRDDWREHLGFHWGLPDSYLYERAKEKALELAAGPGPFALVVLTVNTHSPGLVEKGHPAPWGDFRDALVQADLMMADFVSWIGKQEFAGQTTVVVIGDHLERSPKAGAVELPPRNERNIANVILNPAVDAPYAKERLFASWDFAPTILESVGARFPDGRLGLGTSLFGSNPTLFERIGGAGYEKRIKKRSLLYEELFYDSDEGDVSE